MPEYAPPNRSGFAESRESMACMGRAYWLQIIQASRWQEARRMKGPVTSYPTFIRREEPSPWLGRAPLRVTITSGTFQKSSRALSRILSLSKLEDRVEIHAHRDIVIPVFESRIHRFDWELHGPAGGWITTDSKPNTLTALNPTHDVRLGWEVCADRTYPALPREDARRLHLEVAAHAALENDILIAEDPKLLADRYEVADLGAAGVFSPSEAVRILELWIRDRGESFMMLEEHYSERLKGGLFIDAVVHGLAPNTLTAYRSSLEPARSATYQATVDFLHSNIDRMANLLIAVDELERISQVEGYMGGNNNLLARYGYHAQYALSLMAGLLDVVPWIFASSVGATPSPSRVSWNNLRSVDKPPPWIRDATGPIASLRDLARSGAGMEHGDFIYSLRALDRKSVV